MRERVAENDMEYEIFISAGTKKELESEMEIEIKHKRSIFLLDANMEHSSMTFKIVVVSHKYT